MKNLHFTDDKNYTAKYQVILWDHFGLDIPDMEKLFNIIPSVGETFVCWFILQHLRGYKPFITKITFEKEFNGHLNIGRKEREQQREIDRQQRIDKLVEEEKQKDARRPKF